MTCTVKARLAAKETKSAPEGKTFIAAAKAMDKAIAVAQEQENGDMVRVLEAGRAPLSEHMIEMGIRLPNRRNRKRTSAA